MKVISMAMIAFALIYMLVSLLFKNKVSIYMKNKDLVVLKRNEYFSLQLKFAFLNSFLMIVFALFVDMFQIDDFYVVLYPLVFHTINYCLKVVARKKEYIM